MGIGFLLDPAAPVAEQPSVEESGSPLLLTSPISSPDKAATTSMEVMFLS